jgi:hypothetical protein
MEEARLTESQTRISRMTCRIWDQLCPKVQKKRPDEAGEASRTDPLPESPCNDMVAGVGCSGFGTTPASIGRFQFMLSSM